MITILFKFINWLIFKWEILNNYIYLKKLSVIYKERFTYSSNISAGKNVLFVFDASNSMINLGQGLQVRDRFQIRSCNNGSVYIGENNFFNNDCSIHCLDSVIIGNNNQFGEGVKIYDHNHEYKKRDELINKQGYKLGNIKIGNNCWLGSNVIVLRNVEIGDNVVVGAGCIIYKSIPSNTLVQNIQKLVSRPILHL
jgi:acetyltransferase-like isoleucine patch superfamily enzyme